MFPSHDRGRYINDLPGLDSTQFDLVRKSEDYDIETSWLNVEQRAIRKLEQKLNVWGAKYFKNYNYVDNVVTAQLSKNTVVSSASDFKGLLFNQFLTNYKNMSLHLQYVEVYSDTTIRAPIRIYNAVTGDLLDQVDFNFVADTINRVILQKNYPLWKYPKLFVYYDRDWETSTY